MGCNSPKLFPWIQVADGAVYELSVDCPAGATVFARFVEAHQDLVTWPKGSIAPGPRRQILHAAGETHVVNIHVVFGAAAPVTVTVKAEVTGSAKKYCRDIAGANGKSEIITHTLFMA